MKAALTQYAPRPKATPSAGLSGVPWDAIPLNPLYSGITAGQAINLLPAIGGFAGGLGAAALAAPSGPGAFWAAVGGAGAGGAAGEAAKRALFGQPMEATPIALQGGSQALQEALGMGAAKVGSKLASGLMERAVGPVAQIAKRFRTTPKAIAKEFLSSGRPISAEGQAMADALGASARSARTRILSGPAVPGGYTRLYRGQFGDYPPATDIRDAGRWFSTNKSAAGFYGPIKYVDVPQEVSEASRVPDAMLSETGRLIPAEWANKAAQMRTVTAEPIASAAIGDVEKALGRSLTQQERSALVGKVQDAADAILTDMTHGVVPRGEAGVPSQYTMREIEQIKEAAARKAAPDYAAADMLRSTAATPTLRRQIASGARDIISSVPGAAAQTADVQRAMVADQVIRKSLRQPSRWVPVHLGPLTLGARLPADKLSVLALRLASPAFQSLAKQSPRAAGMLLFSALNSSAPADATQP